MDGWEGEYILYIYIKVYINWKMHRTSESWPSLYQSGWIATQLPALDKVAGARWYLEQGEA